MAWARGVVAELEVLIGLGASIFQVQSCFLFVWLCFSIFFRKNRRSWSVLVRLGSLRARFWMVLGRSGEGFGGPGAAFLKVFLRTDT